ncbi:hypothetical protein [Reyranella sp.]|uniref:hypothetical protein n=1 Tax=Reyranella sp. TaxID=1929291 RepID=UPI003D0AF8FE
MAKERISLPDERLNHFEGKLDQVVELLRELNVQQGEALAAVVGMSRDRANDSDFPA